jgi:protein-serine/threonine kinase
VSEVFSGIHPGLGEAGGMCGRGMTDVRLCEPGICGSEPYIAPEVLERKQRYDPRALDVWSSAIIMIYLIFGGAIWNRAVRGEPHFDSLVKGWETWEEKRAAASDDSFVAEMDYPSMRSFDKRIQPPALRRLLVQMLHPDPNHRIPITEVINNRWMKNVECCQLESYDDPVPIDASKKNSSLASSRRVYFHNHLPILAHGTHSLGKMPGAPGY